MGQKIRKQIRLAPADAQLIEQRARALGVSFSEYARTALLHFREEDEEILMAMAKELSDAFQATARRIDAVIAQMDETHEIVNRYLSAANTL